MFFVLLAEVDIQYVMRLVQIDFPRSLPRTSYWAGMITINIRNAI